MQSRGVRKGSAPISSSDARANLRPPRIPDPTAAHCTGPRAATIRALGPTRRQTEPTTKMPSVGRESPRAPCARASSAPSPCTSLLRERKPSHMRRTSAIAPRVTRTRRHRNRLRARAPRSRRRHARCAAQPHQRRDRRGRRGRSTQPRRHRHPGRSRPRVGARARAGAPARRVASRAGRSCAASRARNAQLPAEQPAPGRQQSSPHSTR